VPMGYYTVYLNVQITVLLLFETIYRRRRSNLHIGWPIRIPMCDPTYEPPPLDIFTVAISMGMGAMKSYLTTMVG